MKLYLVLLVLVYSYKSNANFPKFFQKCNRKDLDFHECCKKASAAGFAFLTKPIPEYGLPNLNPMDAPRLPLSVDPNGVVSTDPNFTNCKIYGLTEVHVDRFEYSFDKKQYWFKGLIPKWVMNCQYSMNGTIFGLPIDGSGNSILTLTNYTKTITFDFVEYQKGDKTHIRFINPVLKKEPETFSLIFEGQDEINKAISANPDAFFESIRDSFEESIAKTIESGSDGFFSIVSVAEAFD